MNHRSQFFNRMPTPQEHNAQYIQIGGEQFHAVAVALIDHLKHSAMPVNGLKKILDGFFSYFPQYKPTQAYLTPAQRMDMLLHNPRKSELVECMAYTLRQLAINELLAQPLNYIDVFADCVADTPVQFLRDSTTRLAPQALNALAKALDITICLSFIERNKPLRYRERFNEDGQTSLTLQVLADSYYPQVRNKADFAYVGQLAINPPKPIMAQDEGTIAPQVQAINEYKKELSYAYEHMHNSLMSMNAAGELPKDKLINLYINFLPTAAKALRMEQLIAELDVTLDKNKFSQTLDNGERELIKSITSSLAGWLCTKQISEEQFFEQMEARPAARVVSVV